MSEAFAQLARAAAHDARSSGRLTLAGPVVIGDTHVLAVANASRDGNVSVAMIDEDKWLDTEQSPHARWMRATLDVSTATPASDDANAAPDDGEHLHFSFETLSPQAQLLVTSMPLDEAQPPTSSRSERHRAFRRDDFRTHSAAWHAWQ